MEVHAAVSASSAKLARKVGSATPNICVSSPTITDGAMRPIRIRVSGEDQSMLGKDQRVGLVGVVIG